MVTVSEKAAARLKELMAEDKKDFLRVFVQGGGCSGFQYGIDLEKSSQEGDQVFESQGIKIVVDPISISYLKGAEVEFDDFKGGFTIKNPNAVSTCGCGQSFQA